MKTMRLLRKEKKKKKIVWNIFNEKANEANDTIDEELFDKINRIKQEIAMKKNKLSTLEKQLDCLNTILERNKRNETYDEGKKIYFPFIIIEFPESNNEDGNKIKVAMNDNKTQAHFAFDSSNKLYGDLDAILKIGNNIILRNKN